MTWMIPPSLDYRWAHRVVADHRLVRAWSLIPVCSGSSDAKSEKNTSAKLTYSLGTFVGASLAIKPAI